MDFSSWLIFLAAALATTFSPGPAVLLVVSNAVSFGSRRALLVSFGNTIGLFLVSATAMIGLGMLLNTSAVLFTGLKLVGAGYMIYLGVRQWRSRANVFMRANDGSSEGKRRRSQFFLQGILLAPTNPKSILFFTALFPQFIKPEQPVLPQFFILTSTFVVSSVISHVVYVLLARRLQGWFSTPRRAQWFNRSTGGVFIFLGAGMFRLKSSPA